MGIMTATATRDVVAGMLSENTGISILDSGGDSGRHWQRNTGLTVSDWENMPSVTIDEYGDVSVNVFHYMVSNLDYCQDWDTQLSSFIDANDYHYYEAVPAWLESIGVNVDEHGPYEGVWEWNTYNWDCLLSQTLQGWTVTFPDGVRRSIVQVHGGADVRGGYTRPRVFDISDDAWVLCDRWEVVCEGQDVITGQLDVDGVPIERTQHTYSVGVDGDLNLYEHCDTLRCAGVKLDYVPCPDCGAKLNPIPVVN